MTISVFIVTCRKLEWLRPCVWSVLEALPPDGELVVLLNGSDEGTVRWVKSVGDSRLRAVRVGSEARATARNRAFEMCDSQIIHWLDDDVVVPRSIFDEVRRRFAADPELAVLGGPNLTPPESRYLEKLFGAVMTSRFAAPLVYGRYCDDGPVPEAAGEHQLILCNLALRRSALRRPLRFKSNLKSNEENLFLFECGRRKMKMVFSPKVYVYHRRRATWPAFWAQTCSYGHGRAQQLWHEPRSCHPFFFVPAAVWLALTLAAAVPRPGGEILGLLTLLHAGLSAWGGWRSATVRSLGGAAVIAMIPLTAMVHLSYGLGLWRGLLSETTSRIRAISAVGAKFSAGFLKSIPTAAAPSADRFRSPDVR